LETADTHSHTGDGGVNREKNLIFLRIFISV